MNEQKSTFRTELAVIPEFGWFLAFAIGICGLIAVFFAAHHDRGIPRAALPFFAILCGAVVICWVLLLTYVNRDAARRDMSPTLWTLVCLFVPNLIGFIIYFILRKPLPKQCPSCGFTVNDSFRFCPHCRYALSPTCSSCGQPTRNDYSCCPYCGQAIAAPTPSPAP